MYYDHERCPYEEYTDGQLLATVEHYFDICPQHEPAIIKSLYVYIDRHGELSVYQRSFLINYIKNNGIENNIRLYYDNKVSMASDEKWQDE